MANQSLFEYLGRPAGSKLGAQVSAYAKTKEIKPETKKIEAGAFATVLTYPIEYLKEYFDYRERWTAVKQYFE